ncbi:MAG: type II toxin-antitoxin system HicA family toxin [Phycisphaerae bacterium]
MPSKLRRLSGSDVLAIRRRFGFAQVAQCGSHVKVRRISTDGTKEILVVPMHRELRTGTLHGTFRQASQHIAEADLRPHFYTDGDAGLVPGHRRVTRDRS